MEALEEDPHVDHHIGMVHKSVDVSPGDQKVLWDIVSKIYRGSSE